MFKKISLAWHNLYSVSKIPLMGLANSSLVTVPIIAAILKFIQEHSLRNIQNIDRNINEINSFLHSYTDIYSTMMNEQLLGIALPYHLAWIYFSTLMIVFSNILVSIFIPNIVDKFDSCIKYVNSSASALESAIVIKNYKELDQGDAVADDVDHLNHLVDKLVDTFVEDYTKEDLNSFVENIEEWLRADRIYLPLRVICSLLYYFGGFGIFAYFFVILPCRVINII